MPRWSTTQLCYRDYDAANEDDGEDPPKPGEITVGAIVRAVVIVTATGFALVVPLTIDAIAEVVRGYWVVCDGAAKSFSG